MKTLIQDKIISPFYTESPYPRGIQSPGRSWGYFLLHSYPLMHIQTVPASRGTFGVLSKTWNGVSKMLT